MRKSTIAFGLFSAVALSSCGGQDRPEFLSCAKYLSLNEEERVSYIESYVEYEKEDSDYPVPFDFAAKLKPYFDQCERYDTSGIGVINMASKIQFGMEPELKKADQSLDDDFGGLTVESSCEAFNDARYSQQQALMDDIINGTSIATGKSLHGKSRAIKSCASEAMKTPCAPSLTVRTAMAACVVTQP